MIKLYHSGFEYTELPLDIHSFPDNTLCMRIPLTSAQRSILTLAVYWSYESDAELFHLRVLRDKFKNIPMLLVMPYIPHARMDRVQHPADCFTLKSFCNAINEMNFYAVYVLDAHSNVSLGLLDNVRELLPSRLIQRSIDNIYYRTPGKLGIFFPDAGAKKRYGGMITGLPVAYGEKDRDWETAKIKGLILHDPDNIKDKNVLIVDDICSRGGTFLHSANALKEAGAKNIYLYVTHAEQSMYQGEMYQTDGLISHIYTTSSLPGHKDKDRVTVYDLEEELPFFLPTTKY